MSAAAPDRPAILAIEPMRWWDIDAVTVLERQLFPGDSPWTPGMFWAELAAGHHYVVHRDPGAAVRRVRRARRWVRTPPTCRPSGSRRRPSTAASAARCCVTCSPWPRSLPVMLEVRTDNVAAIALYESEGFERIGVRRRYYQPSGADAFTMRRPPSAGPTGEDG